MTQSIRFGAACPWSLRALSLLIAFALSAGLGACASGGKKTLSKQDRFELLLQSAMSSVAENDPVGALQLLVEAERIRPESAELHHIRTLAFINKKEPEEALKSAKRTLELSPGSPEYQNNYGKLLIDAGRLAEAEKLLISAGDNHLYREAHKANTNLGILYYRRGEDAKARERLSKATEQNPVDTCIARYYLGHIALRSGKFDAAITNYDRATRLHCTAFADAHYALGVAYERSRQFDKAKKKYLDITQSFPESQLAKRAIERLRSLP